jgi:Tol biopolymer transport system component
MSIPAGTHLASYEIVGCLGAGGMGEVYRARDTKLGRDVAIKVLPELFAADADRLARFQREAQLLAALNHPNIAAIYGLEDSGATRFIVMELVEGESLDARLQARVPSTSGTRGFSRAEALGIARQIIDALEAAHDKGIIHRDLKPANVMLTDDGHVKVLDFGLAKFDAGEAGGSSAPGGAGALTHSPTLTFAATQAGMILGTAAYMSPEQARGRPADKRSDVWAFGCVLYEMLTGKRVFGGEDVTDIIAAVVRADPDWSALPPATTPGLRRILEGCLQKDRKARIPDLSVVRFLLAAQDDERSAIARMQATRASAARWTALIIAGVAGASIAAAIMWAVLRPRPAPAGRTARFVVAPSAQPIDVGGPDRSIVMSPDGTRILSVNGNLLEGGGGQLMIRGIDELAAVAVPGVTNVRAPFVSPDGRWVGFFETGELKKMPMSGGPPITICRVPGGTRGSAWGPDDTIVFATNDAATGLLSVPAGGGEPKVLTKPDLSKGERDHYFPSFLPGGRTILFTIIPSTSLDNAQIAALDLTTGQTKTLVRGATHAEYADGHLLYASAGTLRAVRFDPERLEVAGDPLTIVSELRTQPSGAAQFSVTRNGTLIYVPGRVAPAVRRSLVWVDRSGREEKIDAPLRAYEQPRISPDGQRIAVSIPDQEQDIWILKINGPPLTRLTFEPTTETSPVWTPDGKRVIFQSSRPGVPNLFWKLADGSGSADQLTNSAVIIAPQSVVPGGKTLLAGLAGVDIATLPIEGRQEPAPLIHDAGAQTNAEISPDGRWLAYQSNESGKFQVIVRPFPNVDSGRWQVTSNGGVKPLWSPRGNELFYLDLDGYLTAVSVQAVPEFSPGRESRVLNVRYYSAPVRRTFDISRDGTRFVMVADDRDSGDAQASALVVVLNAVEDIRSRLNAK